MGLKFSKVDQYDRPLIGSPPEYMVVQDDQPIGYVRKRTEGYIQFGTYTYWDAFSLYNHERQRRTIGRSFPTRQKAAEDIVREIEQTRYP